LYRFVQLLKIDTVMNPHENNSTGLCIGIDLVQISAVEASIQSFGAHFMQRIFSDDEVAYALRSPALTAQRLAARFAAKEAAMKAFGLSEAGVGWRDIEVLRHEDGACSLQLHRKAAEIAASTGCTQIALSLSHDGDYATAMVAAQVPH
jgi:holo-[acyl-carrier protein] synthase